MNQTDPTTPETSQDKTSPHQLTPYELLGGKDAIRRLVKQFYWYMDTLPQAQGIRRLHAADLSGAEEKLFLYLTGWLGGPQLFIEKYGHPRLRARHLSFSIGTDEANQWMTCMQKALTDITANENLRAQLTIALTDLALHMRNKTDTAD